MECPREEQNLERCLLRLGCANGADDGLKVVRHYTEDAVFAFGCCIEHAYGGVVGEFLKCHCCDCSCLVAVV